MHPTCHIKQQIISIHVDCIIEKTNPDLSENGTN
jgi:hypothetical protein